MKNILVKNVLKTLEKNGFEAYLVGGAVRDSLLGKKTNDFDIATNALPSDLIKIFQVSKNLGQYGSINILQQGINIDITTYRLEMDYLKRHPTNITYTNNMLLDVERRDFTMNAIYENRHGEKIDIYNGIEHIKAKKIVCIGDAFVKLKEDPLRILRAIRFAIKLDMQLDENLKKAIIQNRKEILSLSKERIKKELDGIFLANGFWLLKEFHFDELLNITLDNICYVHDLAGLWAQIPEFSNFPLEKELKTNIKKINNILKCGTITPWVLYKNGFYVSVVAAGILNVERKKVMAMYRKLPIKTRQDIKISPMLLQKVTNCQNQEIGQIFTDLEKKILDRTLKNKPRDLIRYLERKIVHADD